MAKQFMIEEYGLQPRDLRSVCLVLSSSFLLRRQSANRASPPQLDAHILDVRPSLLICKRSIVLCTPVIRAVITHDKVIIMGPESHNPIVTEKEAMQLVLAVKEVMRFVGKLETPFEFRCVFLARFCMRDCIIYLKW